MDSAPLDNIRIILSHPTHPGNIGAAARAMKTMGITQLFLVNPKRFPDREASDRSAGAQDVLERATVCASLNEALTGTVLAAAVTARHRDLAAPTYVLRAAASQLIHTAKEKTIALVFGTEMSGLTNEEVDKCQLLVSIPSDPGFRSLNLAAAVQLVSYELRMAALKDNDELTPQLNLARLEEVELLYTHLEQCLIKLEFLDPQNPRRLMTRMRRLFARTALEVEEVAIWRGILAAIQRKVD